jgi:hypothetical protein
VNWVCAFRGNIFLPYEWKLAGYDLIDAQDKYVSRVNDLLCEKETGKIRYLLAEIGGLMGISGKKVLVPASLLTRAGTGQVIASATLESIQDSPPLDDPENPTRDEEAAIFAHYNKTPYWQMPGEEPPQEAAAAEPEGDDVKAGKNEKEAGAEES